MEADAVDGALSPEHFAAIEADVGEPVAAIAELERLSSIPANIPAPLSRIDPKWTRLRSDARFRKLVEMAGDWIVARQRVTRRVPSSTQI